MTSSPLASTSGDIRADAPAACDERAEKRSAMTPVFAALVLYAILAGLAAVAQRDQINRDAIAYIRNAVYLSQGRLLDSVSGYWSPLLSWSLAPFMYFGCDGLYASRLVLGLWGAVLVGGAAVFVGRCTALAFPWNAIVLMLVSLAAAQWTTARITPDLLLGALAIWYFGLTAKSDLLLSRRAQLLAGALGGLAYLAKAYAFPFFLAHYSFSVCLHFVRRRPHLPISQAVKALAAGLTAFAVIAGPWIGVLSSKYGRFTFSTAAAFNHFVVGPSADADLATTSYRAPPVPPGRITLWETPDRLDCKDWSPFASSASLMHQVRQINLNLVAIARAIADFDLLGVVPGFLLLMLAIRLAARQRGAACPYPAEWSLMTVFVYAGGFLPIAFEARYLDAVLWPLCCVAVFGVLSDARCLLQAGEPARRGVILVPLLSALCAFSYAYRFADTVQTAAGAVGTVLHPASLPRSPYRDCGQKLAASASARPVAACEGCWDEGLYVSFHAGLPFLGEVRAISPAAVEKSLAESKARVFVASSTWGMLADFMRQTKWELFSKSTAGEETLFVFVAPGNELPLSTPQADKTGRQSAAL